MTGIDGKEWKDRTDGTGQRQVEIGRPGKEGRCPPALPASPALPDYREGSVNATYSPE
jgi:hypothetical protein